MNDPTLPLSGLSSVRSKSVIARALRIATADCAAGEPHQARQGLVEPSRFEQSHRPFPP
jgi:hypothetical protein